MRRSRCGSPHGDIGLGRDGWRASSAAKCNIARRDVKMLADADASKVSLHPIKAGVADLAGLPAPPHVGNKLPRQEGFGRVEFHTYRVTADLSGWKRSPDDNDVHLVIAGPESGKTMIVEFPLAGCIPSTTPAKLQRVPGHRSGPRRWPPRFLGVSGGPGRVPSPRLRSTGRPKPLGQASSPRSSVDRAAGSETAEHARTRLQSGKQHFHVSSTLALSRAPVAQRIRAEGS
jgi:hypothetical protein